MKLSTVTDGLALAGVALIGGGLYNVRPYLCAMFAGVVLVAVARLLATREHPAARAEKEEN